MKTIKIAGSFSGKVSTGSYENSSPFFSIEETYTDSQMNDAEMFGRSQFLTGKCKEMFDRQAQNLTIERIEKERGNIRFYSGCPECGGKHFSVTSVLGWDYDPTVSAEDLAEYAAQGNITHIRSAHFIETGEWLEPIKIPACWEHLHTLKFGKLGLNPDSGNFQAFIEKYPIENMKNGTVVWNCEQGYAGTPDFIGIPKFKGSEPVVTLWDIKRTVDKAKVFMQTSAYAKPLGIKQVGVVPLNDSTDQCFSKPILTTEVDSYYEMFLARVKKFKDRYGL